MSIPSSKLGNLLYSTCELGCPLKTTVGAMGLGYRLPAWYWCVQVNKLQMQEFRWCALIRFYARKNHSPFTNDFRGNDLLGVLRNNFFPPVEKPVTEF